MSETPKDKKTAKAYDLAQNHPVQLNLLAGRYDNSYQLVVCEAQSHRIVPLGDFGFTFPWQPYDTAGMHNAVELVHEDHRATLAQLFDRTPTRVISDFKAPTNDGRQLDLSVSHVRAWDPRFLLILLKSDDSANVVDRWRVHLDQHGNAVAWYSPHAPTHFDHPVFHSSVGIVGPEKAGVWLSKTLSSIGSSLLADAAELVLSNQEPLVRFLTQARDGATLRAVIAKTGARQPGEICVEFEDSALVFDEVASIEETRKWWHQISESFPIGIYAADSVGKVTLASQAMVQLLGEGAVLGYGYLDQIHPEDLEKLQNEAGALIPTDGKPVKDSFDVVLRIKLAHGEYSPCQFYGRASHNHLGEVVGFVGYIQDLSETRRLQARVERAVTVDDLTSLPNRVTLLAELERQLETAEVGSIAVLFVDLDGFKLVNDTQGHSVGDAVLTETASRFERAIRPKDMLARFGGDEFIVVAPGINDPRDAESIANRIHASLATPITAVGRLIPLSTSIGIARNLNEGTTAEELIADADIAMYEAKNRGRNQTSIFDRSLRTEVSRRFDMTNDLRHARRRQQLKMLYQPIVNLKTGEVVGVESLARWHHPRLGLISPAVFINLAEEMGLINDIGEWAIEQSCADLARLRAIGVANENFDTHINTSTMQLNEVDVLLDTAIDAAFRYDLSHSQICFELTESVPFDDISAATKTISTITSAGFQLAIDDYGTGYSSLGYLTLLPFNTLKLDMSLTGLLSEREAAREVTAMLASLSEKLGFELIAEGIETLAQQHVLLDLGIELGQGYLLSRPVDFDTLVPLLKQRIADN